MGGRFSFTKVADAGVEEESGDGVVGLYLIVVDEAKNSAARLARRRGSDGGRNLKGVWKTDGCDEGGLKMMCEPSVVFVLSPPSLLAVRKDSCGGMLRARFIREAVALCRVPPFALESAEGRIRLVGRAEDDESRSCWQQLASGLFSSWASIVFVSDVRFLM